MQRFLPFALLFSLLSFPLFAQQVDTTFRESSPERFIQLADSITIPSIDRGYHLILPENKTPLGIVVLFHADWEGDHSIVPHALERQLGVLFISSGNYLEFFLRDRQMELCRDYLIEALALVDPESPPTLFLGMSLAGTRAMRMAEFLEMNTESRRYIPKALAICDAPLDMDRFYRSSKKGSIINFHPASGNEGYWVSSYLENQLQGTPDSAFDEFVRISPFCYRAPLGGNLNFFPKETAIRIYTEPDIHWWMENRGKDYYDMNAIDAAAVINWLQLQGHQDASLITTTSKGQRPDGTRHPHSWNIVDEEELLDWFLQLIE